MSHPQYTPEFKEEAVRQVTQRGYSVKDVAECLGVSTNSLYSRRRCRPRGRCRKRRSPGMESAHGRLAEPIPAVTGGLLRRQPRSLTPPGVRGAFDEALALTGARARRTLEPARQLLRGGPARPSCSYLVWMDRKHEGESNEDATTAIRSKHILLRCERGTPHRSRLRAHGGQGGCAVRWVESRRHSECRQQDQLPHRHHRLRRGRCVERRALAQ